MFLGPVVDIFGTVPVTSIRTIVSKIVLSEELGQVNSLFSVFEGLIPLAFVPIYVQFYQATINTMPGAFFLVGGALIFLVILIFL